MGERPSTPRWAFACAAKVLVVGLIVALTGPYPTAIATEICEPGSAESPFCVDGSLSVGPTFAVSAVGVDALFDNTSTNETIGQPAGQDVWLDRAALRFGSDSAPPPVITPSEDLPDGLLIAGERPGDTSPCTSSNAFVGCAAGHGTLVARVTGSGFLGLDGFYDGTFGITSIVNVPDTANTTTLAHYRANLTLCLDWSFPTKCSTGTGDIHVPRTVDPSQLEVTMPLRFQVSVSGATIDASASSGVVHLDGASSIANGTATDREYKIIRNPSTCGTALTALAFTSRDGRTVTIPGSVDVTDCDRLADVTIAKSDAPDPVVVRRTLVYSLTASNLGPAAATGVAIRDRLPTYVDPRELPDGCSPAEGGAVVVCDVGDLAVGASATFRIPTDPLLVGERTNTAEVSATSPDPDESNNSDSARTRVVEHSPVSTCVAPEDGLVAWFAGDGRTEDLAGDNDGGTLMNGATYTEGTVGRAFDLRRPVSHVRVPDSAALNITGNLTLDGWVRLASAPVAGGAHTVIEKSAGDGTVTYGLGILPHDTEGDASLEFSSGGSEIWTVSSDVSSWEAERWYHVAAVRVGNNVTLYRDGQPVGSGALAGPAPATPGAAARIGVATDGTRSLAGDADEIAIHSRALSADEISEIHGAGAAGRCKSGRPSSVATPTLTGTPSPDEELTCHPGSWEGDIERLSYVWDRAPRMTTEADDPAWAAIDGANGPTYVVQDIDIGSRVRCREIVTTSTGSVSAASNSLRVDEASPVSLSPPVVVGTPIISKGVVCDPGVWKNEPDLRYQWYRGVSPIDGATGNTFVLRLFGDDALDKLPAISCEVTGANDVGTTTSERSAGVQPVRNVPKIPLVCVTSPIQCAGRVTKTSTGTRPLDVELSCTPGRWRDTGTWVDAAGNTFGGYEYQWLREGAPIADATNVTYDITSDDLGRNMACRSWAVNPAGRSQPLGSRSTLIGLPAGTSTGAIYKTGGDNEFDPVNLLTISADYRNALNAIALRRLEEAMAARTQECISDPHPGFEDPSQQGDVFYTWFGEVLSAGWTCGVLTDEPDAIVKTPWGAFWLPPDEHGCEPGPWDEVAPGVPCPALDIAVAPVDPTNPEETLTPAEIDSLRSVTPQRILWDVNKDGRVDAECPGTAPVLRSLYRPGQWDIRAVIVGPDSDSTGIYDSSRVFFPFPNIDEAPAKQSPVRSGQPFACRTSFEPPPKTAPDLPCVTDATIGRVRLQGNFCPINIRAIDSKNLKLDDGTMALLRKIAEDYQALSKHSSQTTRAATTHAAGAALDPADRYISSVGLNMSSALAGTGSYTYKSASSRILKKLDGITAFNLAKADFALDQIYIANGPSKVNGVQVIPQGGTSSLLVPADAAQAINTVKGMTLASANARTALMAKGSEVPLDPGGQLTKTFADATGATNNVFGASDLNALSESLKDKLNLGPFKLAGIASVTLKDDGTVRLTARAVLPALSVSPSGTPASTSITLEGDRNGNLKLRGARLQVPSAFLFGTMVKDLDLKYDANDGLEAKGQVLLWPSGPGVAINRLKLGPTGSFDALDVDYLAPAGTGIPISGPFQVYLTKIGGGFSTNPDEFFGRTALSVGPSPGGGCPTIGMEAEFRIHTAPAPFWARATGEGQLACIPLANVTFEVRGDGYVSLNGGWNFDAGPIYFSAGIGGRVRLPNWTVEASGEGGIRKVLSGRVEAVLSNIGLAACGKIVMPDPFADIAGGAGVRFTDGRPPLHFAELLANLKLFTGCDLGAWRSVQAQSASATNARVANGARAAMTAGGPLLIADGTPGIALSFEGAGDAPRIKLRRPDGTLLDFTDAHEGKRIVNAYGVVLDEEDRTVVLISEPQGGQWTVETAEGSEPVADIRAADILPEPSVKGTVSGKGAKRTLRYDVDSIPGQVVHFVEHAQGASQTIATVKGGGKGEVKFRVAEAEETARTIVAEVNQGGLPRETITVAEFDAPNPAVGRPKDPTIRRKGTTALVKWRPAALADSYEVTVRSSDGTTELLTTRGRKVVIPEVGRREKLRVTIVAISPAGRRGPGATVRLR